MKHKHSVYDTDAHFSINPFTRAIKNESTTKVAVIQHDHNSERFTFEIPRRVDGHDMSVCDRVEVHYINMDSTNPENISADIYEVDDLQVSPDDSGFVVCSWLLSQNATKYAGSLNFLVRFICLDEGKVAYAWHTAVFTGISVSNGILNNAEEIIEPFPDVLAQWKADLFGVGDTQEQRLLTVSAEQQAAIAAKGQAVLDSIPDEYEALQAQADGNTRIKAGAIVLDAEGESIVVNDASDFPMMGLKLFGKSTQDGSPTPDAPVDIVSVESPSVSVHGKNLIPPRVTVWEYAGLTFTGNADGTVSASGTVKSDEDSTFHLVHKDTPLTLPKGDYLLSGVQGGSEKTFRILVYKTDWTFLTECADGSKPFSLNQATDVFVYIWVARGTTVNKTFHPMIRFASVADESFETYTKQAVSIPRTLPGIPVTSGGNYTDADGQRWVRDEIDLKRGVHVHRCGYYIFDGSDDEEWNGIFSHDSKKYVYIKVPRGSIQYTTPLICNYAKQGAWSSENVCFINNFAEFVIGGAALEGVLSSVTAFKAHLAVYPIMLAYVLETPVETALSDVEIAAFKALHSNKPNTTILNDAGAFMAVEYVADTKTYIDNKIAALLSNET